MAPVSALAEIRRFLRQSDLKLSKRLGQHLLIDRDVLETIVEAANLSPEDRVVEVGAGPGILTAELLPRARMVVAIELDPRMASALSQRFSHHPRLKVINADVLKVHPADLLAGEPGPEYKVVANLPYYIASPVLRYFLEAEVKPRLMVVTVQKEVAQSIAATSGKRSLLSVSVQLYGRPTILAYVPAHCFYPSPKVDSAILRIEVYPRPAVEAGPSFFEAVKAGFSAPRKQLRNALAQGLGLPPGEASQLLAQAAIDPTRRAQTLSLEEWARLSASLGASRPPC